MTLDLSPDDVAGVVDMFGALTREELDEALDELAFRRDEERPAGLVDDALDAYAIVAYDPGPDLDDAPVDDAGDVSDERTGDDAAGDGSATDDAAATYLAPGPSAFPTIPEGAGDLPHILDVSPRTPDRAVLARAVESRFRGDVARVVAAGDAAEVERLLDVSYDLEAWGPVDLGDLRARLDDALAEFDE